MTVLSLVPATPKKKSVRSIRTKVKRQSYKYSVEWIAENDQPDDFNMQTVAALGSVELLAYLHRKTRLQVTLDVLKYRCSRCCPTYEEEFS
jgi:hypothetical protein